MPGNDTAIAIRDLTPADAPGCDAVLASLPYFFGDPTGIKDCAKAVRSQNGFVAVFEGRVVGFVTLLFHFPESAEITWMAVHAEHRRSGIGAKLMRAADDSAVGSGAKMLCVMTLGPSVTEPLDANDNYDGTRRFYRAQGFVPLRELGLREWNDSHALMLARTLP
jgi:GNAT superfamily N-acetyltransferase